MKKKYILGLVCTLFSASLLAHGDESNLLERSDFGGSLFAQFGYYQDSRQAETWSIPGVITGDNAVHSEQGLQLMHGEVAFTVSIESVLAGHLILGSHHAESATVEELWLQPDIGENWQLRIGRQLTDIGLYNATHDHDWLFVDANLSQQAFLASQYSDDSIQLRWSDDMQQFTTWIGRGNGYPASVDKSSAIPHAYGVAYEWQWFGEQNSVLLKSSLTHFNAYQRGDDEKTGHTHGNGNDISFTGDTNLVSLGLQWQWMALGWDIEWMAQQIDAGLIDSQQFQTKLDATNQGISSQLYWQWQDVQVAFRYDALLTDNKVTQNSTEFANVLDSKGHNPERLSLVMNWFVDDNQILRVQGNFDQTQEQKEQAFWLIYQGNLYW